MLGFRFPAYAEGIEIAGHHLHFISDDRRIAATSSTPAQTDCGCGSTPPTTSTSSCRRGSSGDPDLAKETHAAIVRAEGG